MASQPDAKSDAFTNGTPSDVDSDAKQPVTHAEHASSHASPAIHRVDASLAPELVRALTSDERRVLERRLIRKIDLRLLPMLILMYIMNYLDRNNIASARLAGKRGLQKGLNMSDVQYEVCPLPLHAPSSKPARHT